MKKSKIQIPTVPLSQDVSEYLDVTGDLRYEPVTEVDGAIRMMLNLLDHACRCGDTIIAGKIALELYRMKTPLTARATQEVGDK